MLSPSKGCAWCSAFSGFEPIAINVNDNVLEWLPLRAKNLTRQKQPRNSLPGTLRGPTVTTAKIVVEINGQLRID
jgi:hypothetical protein